MEDESSTHLLLGLACLVAFGLALIIFSDPIDALMFTACLLTCSAIIAEIGVWLGWVERK